MKYLLLLSCSLLTASPAWAQCEEAGDCLVAHSAQIDPHSIIVVATGSATRVSQIGQSVSVFTAEDLAQVQGPDLTRVLERLPGVSYARSGGLGSQTSLFVRGANSEQLLVLVDGVRMEDVAAPSGGFDLGTLLPAGIGKIELLRGSNSVAWGSAAIGGVLAVHSDTRPGLRGAIEYGSHDSLVTSLGGTLGNPDSYVSLHGGYTRSDGISAFAGGKEPDAFRQWNVAAKGRFKLSEGAALFAAGRYADSRIDFDGFPPPAYTLADTPEYQTTRQASGRTGVEFQTGILKLASGLALSDTRRSYFDPSAGAASNFDTRGRSVRADVTGQVDLVQKVKVDFGADSEWTRFSTSFDALHTARLASGHVLFGFEPSHRLNLTAGLRYDDHDRFGGHWSFGADGVLKLGAGWRLRAAWGQGFKAPTLYQLYGYGGLTTLKPETSESVDFGIERGDRNAPKHFALTLFRRTSRDLISYLSPTGYFNTARALAQGFELEAGARISPQVTASAAYTYLEATDRSTGRHLARRPRHAVTTSIDWTTPLAGLQLGADLRLVGDSFDDSANRVRLDGYAIGTVRASVPIGDHFELFGRIENLTDARYQVAADYGTYGRSGYVGARLRW